MGEQVVAMAQSLAELAGSDQQVVPEGFQFFVHLMYKVGEDRV